MVSGISLANKCQLLFGFGEITLHEICFAKMFVRAAAPRIKR